MMKRKTSKPNIPFKITLTELQPPHKKWNKFRLT